MAIERPEYVSEGDFNKLIQECWAAIPWSSDELPIVFGPMPEWIQETRPASLEEFLS
jgi:hypothetical protein